MVLYWALLIKWTFNQTNFPLAKISTELTSWIFDMSCTIMQTSGGATEIYIQHNSMKIRQKEANQLGSVLKQNLFYIPCLH